MNNTERSFRDKWFKNADRFFRDTLTEGTDTQRWILNRNGFAAPADFRAYLATRKRILDGGCGNGRVTALLRSLAPESTEIVGIDLVAADVARKNLEGSPNITFETRDILGDLTGLGQFDFIYSQEVLHHTSDPRGAFLNLCSLLAPGGEIAIYVYKQKAPVREYVDDFVRDRIAAMEYEEARTVCEKITELGRALSSIDGKVTVPDVPTLGIEAGEYDVQRFFYHFFMKCYWNPELDHEENVVVNYDWYHPQLATRHTPEEVEEWFDAAALEVVHRAVDHYGITVRGRLG